MKSNKMPYIFYAEPKSNLNEKNRWMHKQSRKIFNNQNRLAYSL